MFFVSPKRLLAFLFAFTLLPTLFSRAQTAAPLGPGGHPDVIFQQLNQKNGLPGPVVQALAQDASGFMWVATENGISRWDGYHFRNYSMQLGVPGTLPENNVFSLYADPQGRFWLGTKSRGLVLFDPAHDRFESFVPDSTAKTYKAIYALLSDGKGGLFVGTKGFLDHFDPATHTFRHIAVEGAASAGSVLSLVRDNSGHIWAGTTRGLFRSDSNGEHFTLQSVFPADKAVHVWSLLFGHDGRLWIGATAGAYVLDPGDTTARPITEPGNALDAQGIDTIAELDDNTIWLGTYANGIVAVDQHTLQISRLGHDASIATSLASDSIVALRKDAAGSVWAGTLNGVSRTDPAHGIATFYGTTPQSGATSIPAKTRRIGSSDITSVLVTANGRTWLGYNSGGLEVFDSSGAKLASIAPEAITPAKDGAASLIEGLTETPSGDVYFGNARGLYRVDKDAHHLMHVASPDKQPQWKVEALAYNAGTLWIAGTEGLAKLDLGHGSASLPVAVPAIKGEIISLTLGRANDLWLGNGVAIWRYDLAANAVEEMPIDAASPTAPPALVNALTLDRNGRLWAATFGGGVCVLDRRDAQGKPLFRRISGLPNNNADDILLAADGSLWASTDDGLARIDPSTFAVESFHQPDGVAVTSYWVGSGFSTPDGRLLFGGGGGLTVVQPTAVHPWSYVPPVVVGDVLSEGKHLSYDDHANSVLEVQPYANSLDVDFAALDFTAPELNQYQYRLVGFDKEWIATDPTRRAATYTNLPPGRYTLELRAAGRNGIWGPVRRIPVRVFPAWWQTWWALVLFIVLCLILLVEIYYLITAYQRRRQKELEQKVELRTQELQEAALKLEESHRQMEKIAFTDSLTGLSNRRYFNDFFRHLTTRRETSGFALLLIDLDKFKDINDTYGHDAGDAWLKEVAARISPEVRSSDCFARLGGDEFGILLSELKTQESIAGICEKILTRFLQPIMVGDIEIRTSLSIGTASFPEDGAGQEALYKAADIALYSVKAKGGNGWRNFGPDLINSRGQGESPTRRTSD